MYDGYGGWPYRKRVALAVCSHPQKESASRRAKRHDLSLHKRMDLHDLALTEVALLTATACLPAPL